MNLLVKIIGLVSLLLMIGDLSYGKTESRLRVGKSINVFVRYGYLGISMKVISYNDTERWLFKEPTNNVFLVSSSRVCSDIFHHREQKRNHHIIVAECECHSFTRHTNWGLRNRFCFFLLINIRFSLSLTFRNWCKMSNVWIWFLLYSSFQCNFRFCYNFRIT